MRLGFIGFGTMGRPMAGHLLAAGHALYVWARRADALTPLLELGAHACASPAAVAQEAEVVFTNVTGSADVEALALAPEGLLAGLAPGSVHVDFSTIAPSVAQRLGERYAAGGVDFVDAPVSGGGVGAQNASLAIMWGGRAALAPRLAPLFALLGKTVVRVGDCGAGQVAKACNQMVMVAAIEACAEAARLAAASGVDFGRVRSALQGGSAASRVLDVFGERMARREFAAGVEARLHHKDYALFMAEAVRRGVPLPVSAAVWQQLNALLARGWGRDDSARLLCVLEAAAAEDSR